MDQHTTAQWLVRNEVCGFTIARVLFL